MKAGPRARSNPRKALLDRRAELSALALGVLRIDEALVVGVVVGVDDFLVADEEGHRPESIERAFAVLVVHQRADGPAVLLRVEGDLALEHLLRLAAELDDRGLGVAQPDVQVVADFLLPIL